MQGEQRELSPRILHQRPHPSWRETPHQREQAGGGGEALEALEATSRHPKETPLLCLIHRTRRQTCGPWQYRCEVVFIRGFMYHMGTGKLGDDLLIGALQALAR